MRARLANPGSIHSAAGAPLFLPPGQAAVEISALQPLPSAVA